MLQPNSIKFHQYISIAWQRPTYTAGNIDFYELELAASYSTYIYTRKYIVNGNNTECLLDDTVLCDKTNITEYVFRIRAINVETNELSNRISSNPERNSCDNKEEIEIFDNIPMLNKRFGDWAKEMVHHCHIIESKKEFFFKEFFFIGASSLLFLFSICFIIFCRRKFKEYNDIKSVLPEGLIKDNKDIKSCYRDEKYEKCIVNANRTMEISVKTNLLTKNYLFVDKIETNKNYKVTTLTESNYNIVEKGVKQTTKVSNKTSEVISTDDSDGKV